MSAGEVRVDPLTGLRVIIAPERAGRPGALAAVARARADRPRRRPVRPRPRGRRRRPTPAPRRPAGDGPVARARRSQPLPGADRRTPPTPRARRAARPVRRGRGRARRARGDRQRAGAGVARSPTWRRRRSLDGRGRCGASACARTPAPPACTCIVNERLAGGASLPHTHAQLYALDFVPARVARERERFGAYAVADDGRQPARRPRAGGGPPARADRRHRRRGRADGAVAARLPFQLLLAPRRAARALRGRRPDRRRAAARRRCAACARRLGASPPLNLWVRTAPRGAEHFCWRIDIAAAAGPPAGLELGHGRELNIVAPEQAAAELRDA